MDDSGKYDSLSEIINNRDNKTNVDINSEVLIKSEKHLNKKDLMEEIDLIRTNEFDTLLLELARENLEEVEDTSGISLVFDWITGLLFFILHPLYTNSIPLLTAAFRNETTPYYTREKDGNILQDMNPIISIPLVVIWFILLIATSLFGLLPGNIMISTFSVPYILISLICYILALSTPYFVREIRNNISGNLNRNRVIADKIEDIHKNSNRTLAVLGNKHAEKVENHLSDDIESDIIPKRDLAFDLKLLLNFAKVCILTLSIWLILIFVGELVVSFIL
jgi:hypothetical protein